MLNERRFALQTLDFRALGEREWAELKVRLERRARAERSAAVRAMIGAAYALLRRWGDRLFAAAREWTACRTAQAYRAAMKQLHSLDDRDFKDMGGLRRSEIYAAVYRRDRRSIR